MELYRFSEKVQLTDALSDLDSHFTQLLSDCGYKYFTYAQINSYGATLYRNVVNTVPSEWLGYYFEQGYHLIDPVIEYLASGVTAERWDRLFLGAPPEVEKCLLDAEKFGLINGIIIPIRGGSQETYSLSASGRSGRMSFEDMCELQAACMVFHDRRRTLLNADSSSVRLTKKQTEYLTKVAEGKTIKDVATIFSVTESAVEDGLKKAYRRLGVTNLQGAIAQAMSLRLIRPNVMGRRGG